MFEQVKSKIEKPRYTVLRDIGYGTNLGLIVCSASNLFHLYIQRHASPTHDSQPSDTNRQKHKISKIKAILDKRYAVMNS